MKIRIYPLTFLVIVMTGFFSCDYINPPYTVAGPNGCTVSEPNFTPRTNPKRKVLVEDFTGHKCGFCPDGHIALDALIEDYNDQVVGIALHSSLTDNFTKPDPPNADNKYIYDFRSTEASGIDDEFGINTIGIPNGLVNRKTFGSTKILAHSIWDDKVATELSLDPVMDIQLKNFYDETEQSICSFAFVEALEDLNSNYKLVILLTEDSIVNWQKFYGNVPEHIPNYVHDHVLRTSFTNLWGVDVAGAQPMQASETFVDGYSISTSGKDWNINHLKVVAFVYDAVTYEVIQSEETKLIP